MDQRRPGLASLSPLLPLLLPLAVLAVYLPGVSADFVFDDQVLVLKNGLTDSLRRAPEMFRVGLWESVPGLPGDGKEYYRPLMLLSLAVDRALGGFSPVVAHLQNLGWHLAAVGLLFRLLESTLGDRRAAVAGAALFAVHPAQVEAVQWISARNDPMAATFLLLSLSLLSDAERPAWRTAAGGLAALAALLCKESALASPLLLALICQARGRGWGDRAAYLSLLAATAVYAALRASAGAISPAIPLEKLPGAIGMISAFYAERLLWTPGLPPLIKLAWAPPTPWWALGVLAALVGLALWRGGRLALIGLALAALTWAPSLGGLLVTAEPASRYLYLPLVGLGLTLGASLRGRDAAGPVALALLVALTATSARLLPRWRDDQTLWTSTLAMWPSPYAHGAYAKFLEERGELDQAAEHYRLATAPPRPYDHSCFNITAIHLKRGDPAAAVRDGQAALAAGCAPSPELLGPLSIALAATGDWEAAERAAAQVGPDPTGKAVLVRVAAAARRGDLAPFDAVAGGSREALAQQVGWLLRQGGAPDAAEATTRHAAGEATAPERR